MKNYLIRVSDRNTTHQVPILRPGMAAGGSNEESEAQSQAASVITLLHEAPDGSAPILRPRDFAGSDPFKESSEISNMALSRVISSYIQYYASGDTHTAKAKRLDLDHFYTFMRRENIEQDDIYVADWTREATIKFIADRLNIGESPATINRRLATLKHLGRTLADRVTGFVNPAREVKGIVFRQNVPSSLDAEQIQIVRQTAQDLFKETSFISLRNLTLVETLLQTGLRADEVRNLKLKQLGQNMEWFLDVMTKGRKLRNVYIPSSLRDLITQYVQARHNEIVALTAGVLSLGELEKLLADSTLFVSFRGFSPYKPASLKLNAKTIWIIIERIGKSSSSGLSPEKAFNLHPHILRHTFANGLLEASSDIRLVAQALGHSDVRTTMRYTERHDEKLASALEKAFKK